jgi:hypothetical protein
MPSLSTTPPSETFRPGTLADQPAAGERYQVRVRVPHDSGKNRLGLNGVREAVKRI